MADLTSQQTQQILQQRPDVAANKYYSKNVGEWYKKYGQKEGFSFGATPTTPQLSIAQQSTLAPAPTYTPSAVVQSGQPGYSFDPNQYLPQINTTAESIYGPQKAQLEAMRGLIESQGKQTEEKTYADYNKRLQQEIEAINNRGAYFGGGAINAETDIRTQRDYDLQQQKFQTQASMLGNQAQQSALSAQQAEYVRNQLQGAQGSAYQQYRDKVSDYQFNSTADYNKYRDQVGDYQANRDFTFKVLTDERDYGWDVEKFMKNYNLDLEQFKLAQAEFKQSLKKYDADLALDKLNLSLKAGELTDGKTKDYFNAVNDAYSQIGSAKSQEQVASMKEALATQLDAQFGSGAGNAVRNYQFKVSQGVSSDPLSDWK